MNGQNSPFMWKYIHWKGEFCPLVGEFYPFVGINSVGGINCDQRIKFYVAMFVYGKLYHFKGKFYHTNGYVKVKYFFSWRDTFVFYDVR